MATTIRKENGQEAVVELTKQGREPLWEVALVTREGRLNKRTYIGRVMNSNGQWYREYGFGWEARPTRKQCLLSLLNRAEV